MYNIDCIRKNIIKYKLKKILDSGENDMFDDKIDRKKIEEVLNEESTKKSTLTVDMEKTIENIDSSKLYESIINLKEKKQYVE